ncbi:YjeF [Microbotryum lychnidis-dioicae p1A1 Lamole]|uniref:ATP-dependent (S)-NAD(P)H-hydrate dehydratase n=1 Tax=Microbotryum lychnidis-dioicae (strain p1A1 Lamole / MvSl-1064) TaxID=683840 RepID=U5HF01_USTV1|nr:YjeF [Microbotryum lychnidis-dioicae p1A1 Lamole]|eukprot:KDE03867.1 YjeF [Microbotryum lychnidis-dioicae p1A1 Lamole]
MPSHRQILARCQRLVPPLSPTLHKGQAGRIAVVGGSQDYSGAPFFSSMTTLRLGADLAHVICEPSAGNIVKTYSPDLIVHTDLVQGSTEASLTNLFESLLPRLHVLVIGPGLGRSNHMQLAARTAISLARKKGLFIIIDADGLWLVQSDPKLIQGYPKAVLTPNVVEFKRLCKAVNLDTDSSTSDPSLLAGKLAKALGGVTVLEKGTVDRIVNNDKEEQAWINETKGSLRRCGGQGDVLSGAVGCFLAWGLSYLQKQQGEARVGEKKSDPITEFEIPRLAAYAASTITRTASRLTFEKKKRAMQTSDMLNFVGEAFEEVFPDMVVEEEQQEEGGKDMQ